MRHRKAGIKLNRTASHRDAMFRNMVTSLLKHERIRTTHTRAMEVRRWADKMITLAKRGDLHARRQALSVIREKAVVHKLFEEAPQRFGTISGGYTRVIKLGRRPGDAAPVSIVELVSGKASAKPRKKPKTEAKPVEIPAVAADAETPDTESAGVEAQPETETVDAPSEAAAEEAPSAQAQSGAAEDDAGDEAPAAAKDATQEGEEAQEDKPAS